MKPFKLLCCFSIVFVISSCTTTHDLIRENNQFTQEIKKEVDSIKVTIDTHFDTLSNTIASPSLKNLHQVSFNDFYAGNIKEEKLTDISKDWRKIELKKVIFSGQEQIEVLSKGYINLNAPEIVYEIAKEALPIAKKSTIKFQDFDVRSYKKMGAKSFITQRTDIYSQKEVDQMIANDQYNFDGFKFTNKRFDFLDFSKGSFRGTLFDNSFLNNGIGKRTAFDETAFDFERTQIGKGTQEYLHFEFWKFTETVFSKLTIKDSKFINCLFKDSNFNEVRFEKTTFSNKDGGLLNEIKSMKSTFISSTFDNAKIYSGTLWANTFQNCVFRDFDIKWTGLVSFGTNFTKFDACRFYNGRFFSGSQKKMIIENQFFWTEFSNVDFIFPIWQQARIKAWFKDGCTFDGGSAADLSSVEWLTSIFSDTVFGSQNSPTKLNMKNGNFSNVDFRPGVIFYDCDFTGSTWPDLSEMQNAGVKFYNCVAAPYNSN